MESRPGAPSIIADAEKFTAPDDEELKSLAADELIALRKSKAALDTELPIMLLPKDPNDEKNVVMEIRGDVGGDEATLFAGGATIAAIPKILSEAIVCFTK